MTTAYVHLIEPTTNVLASFMFWVNIDVSMDIKCQEARKEKESATERNAIEVPLFERVVANNTNRRLVA